MKVFSRPNVAARFDLANGWTASVATEIMHADTFVSVAWWPTGDDGPEAMQAKGMLTPEDAFAWLLFVSQLEKIGG